MPIYTEVLVSALRLDSSWEKSHPTYIRIDDFIQTSLQFLGHGRGSRTGIQVRRLPGIRTQRRRIRGPRGRRGRTVVKGFGHGNGDWME